MIQHERGIRQVPGFILLGFVLVFGMQVAYQYNFKTRLSDQFKQLDPPQVSAFYRSVSLGSDRLLSYLLILGVQMHDNQAGLHRSYTHLDYQILGNWLQTLYELNPSSDYPAFLASRVYSQVADAVKVRQMVVLIEELFELNPRQHWRRMTEATLLAKHQLNDLPLALRLAEKISALPKSIEMPFWARDMEIVLLDELNQHQSAQLLISSLLQSGEITDPDVIRFLQFRLLRIQQILSENRQEPKK